MLSKDSVNNSDLIEGGEKVVVIGDASVGKSSMIMRFINSTFSENIKPTIGCDHYEKELSVGSSKIKLSIWDTAGQERFRGLSSSYYKKAKCVIVMYDITRKSTFEKIEFWKDEIANFAEPDIITVLVGTKLDLQDKRAIIRDEAVNYSNKHKFAFFTEVSAVENQNQGIETLMNKVAELILEKLQQEAGSKTHANVERNGGEQKVDLEADKKPDSDCKC